MMTRRQGAEVLGAILMLTAAVACGGAKEGGADTAAAAAAPAPAADTAAAATASAADTGMVNPDQATRDQLMAVPGMTAGAADALVAGRPYADMVAVDKALAAQVADSAARKALYARLWKPIDLNKASDAEILLIPGVGRRMLHEFKEYRPYADMARFHREIGKYVKPDELARLEKYVSVR